MSDQTRYPRVLRAVTETPWAIRAEKLVVIRELIALRAAGGRFSREEIEARVGSGASPRPAVSQSSVAVIPIYGVITPKADLLSEFSGGTSMQGFSESLRRAVADDSVGSILLDVDSPGGMTDLVSEAAAEIREARAVKPIVAIANTDAASAAYWLASQADEVVVTPSGFVGSIGVFAAHDDVSAAMEQDGVKTTLISAGRFKTEGNPFEPLSEEARGAIQARVDAFYGMFVDDVAQGRGVPSASVRDGFGEGRVVTAQDALRAGMVDRVDTFEATVERMLVEQAPAGHSMAAFATGPPGLLAKKTNDQAADSGLSFAQTAVAIRDAADRLTADAGALRVLTAAKRDVLSQVSESLAGSSRALAELVAESAADPGSDALARRLLADARSRHFPAIGAAR